VRARLEVLEVQHQERSESLTLTATSPAEARSIVSEFAAVWRIEADVAQRAELLVSEIVADAVDHGSDAATLRISLDEEKLELELFDGPRRSAIARSGREEGVPTMRMRVLAKVADGRYSSDLGESHYARYEIRSA
jgi:anti-sigma regulatory factor (Ser/Thr protein kinase)